MYLRNVCECEWIRIDSRACDYLLQHITQTRGYLIVIRPRSHSPIRRHRVIQICVDGPNARWWNWQWIWDGINYATSQIGNRKEIGRSTDGTNPIFGKTWQSWFRIALLAAQFVDSFAHDWRIVTVPTPYRISVPCQLREPKIENSTNDTLISE